MYQNVSIETTEPTDLFGDQKQWLDHIREHWFKSLMWQSATHNSVSN
jgi:hypothetical protein